MKRMKKSLAILLALMLCLSLLTIGASAADDNLFADAKGKLVIIHTNDVHGRDVANASQYGTAAVAQLKKDYEAAGASVLLLSAGDAIQGLPIVNYDYGASAIEFLSAAGYDAMSPGNHEFDWGAQNLFDILENADFFILSANIVYTEDNEYGGEANELVFQGNTIFILGDLKIGVFGLTTPETFTKAHPDKVKGVAFLQGDEMFAAAQEQVDYLKGEDCDLIICLGHLGIDDESAGNRSTDVIDAVSGIDLFVDGHSHTVIPNGKEVKDTLLVSTGTALANIGVVVFDPDDGSLTASLLGITGGVKAYDGLDAELNTKINDYDKLVTDTLKSQVIGSTEILLYGKNTVDPQGVRVAETNLGDFATDALLWLANREYGEGFADAALTNGGGIRDSIPVAADSEFPYEITMFDMVTVFPFGNQVEIVEITGAQLLEALEAATFSNPAAVGAFPQVSGIEFSIYNFIPYERGDQYEGSTYYAPADPGARIRDVKVGGQPLDLDKVYRIATNDFTAAGGDTYAVFKDKTASYSTGVAMEQALIDYLAEELDGVIGDKYAQPQGRMTLVNTFIDINQRAWYIDAFDYVFANGLMTGTTDITWQPALSVNRATAIMTLYNLEGRPAADGENFRDIPETAWYYDAALWARGAGVSEGSNGMFIGAGNITRTELAAIFVRYLELCGYQLDPADLSDYEDAGEIPAWAVEQGVMEKIVATGIIAGRSASELAPNATATRAELAQMLFNMADYIARLDFVVGRVAELIYGGNLSLGIQGKALFNAGFEIGDIVTVRIGDLELDMPICANYNDVDVMDNLVRIPSGSADREVIVAINMSAFALKYIGEVGDYVYFTMKEKGGYLDALADRPAETGRTNVRDDYESDQVFANFREITLGDIAAGVLYRSSSPVDPGLGRAAFADKFCEEAGIAVAINLANSDTAVEAFFAAEGFNSPYYKGLYENDKVIALNMGVDFFYDAVNRDKLKAGIEFMLANDGPYLIHCTEGKDRAGFVSALLEALMGATIAEIKDDYMQTYVNYFHFEKGSADYEKFAEFAILPLMCLMAGVDKGTDLSAVDLAEAANGYLLGIGLEQAQIDNLVATLSGKAPVAAAA